MREVTLSELKGTKAYSRLTDAERAALDAKWDAVWVESEPTPEMLREWLVRDALRQRKSSSSARASATAQTAGTALARAARAAPSKQSPMLATRSRTTAVPAGSSTPTKPAAIAGGKLKDPRGEELFRRQAERRSAFVRDIGELMAAQRGISMKDLKAGAWADRFFESAGGLPGRATDPSGVFTYGAGRDLPRAGSWDWESALFGRNPLRERKPADVRDGTLEGGLVRHYPEFRQYRYVSKSRDIAPELFSGIARLRAAEAAAGSAGGSQMEPGTSADSRVGSQKIVERPEQGPAQGSGTTPPSDSGYGGEDDEIFQTQVTAAITGVAATNAAVRLTQLEAENREAEEQGRPRPHSEKELAEARRESDALHAAAEEAEKEAYEAKRRQEEKQEAEEKQRKEEEERLQWIEAHDAPEMSLPFLPPTEAGELIRREQARRRAAIAVHSGPYNPLAANIAEGGEAAPTSADIRPRKNRVADPTGLGARDPRAEAAAAGRPGRPDLVSRPTGEFDVPNTFEPEGTPRRPNTPFSVWSGEAPGRPR